MSSFLGDLFAGLLLLALASWFIPTFFRWRQLPNVRLLDYKRRKEAFVFTAIDEKWEATLRLVIQNRGSRTLEKYYWEMYVENGVDVEFPRIPIQPGHATIAEEPGEQFRRIYGYMVLPIFPLDDVDFPFEIKLKVSERRPVAVHYFFRTEYGQDPFWSWIGLWLGKFWLLKKIVVR